MREGDHAVDVRKVAQGRRIETPGDVAADRRGAVHRRNDGDVVSRAGAAVGAAVAEEGLPGERRRGGGYVGRARALAGEFFGGEVWKYELAFYIKLCYPVD